MKRHFASALLLLFLASPAFALNENRPRDSVNFELLGKSIAYSLGGEVGLGDRLALGAGFGPVEDGDDPGSTFVFPMHLSWLSHRTHGLYLAAGATYVHNSEATGSDSELYATLTVGGQLEIRRAYLRFEITHFEPRDADDEEGVWDWGEPPLWQGITFGFRF